MGGIGARHAGFQLGPQFRSSQELEVVVRVQGQGPPRIARLHRRWTPVTVVAPDTGPGGIPWQRETNHEKASDHDHGGDSGRRALVVDHVDRLAADDECCTFTGQSGTTVHGHRVGATPSSSQVDFSLVLKLRDPAGAAALVKSVSDPTSSSYRHYVTTKQWEARFSPSVSDVNQAEAWLKSEGFTVGALPADRITVPASGTAAQVEKTFGTSLGEYTVDRPDAARGGWASDNTWIDLEHRGRSDGHQPDRRQAGRPGTPALAPSSPPLPAPPTSASRARPRPTAPRIRVTRTPCRTRCAATWALSCGRPTTSRRPTPARATRSPSSTPTT